MKKFLRSNSFVIGLCLGTAINLIIRLVIAWENTQ